MAQPPSHDDVQVLLAAMIHDQLREHLRRTYPLTSIDLIITALTYEIGRLVGEQAPSDLDVDAAVDSVAANMKAQIRAYRDGRLKG